jgi:heme-degrading monooxygenase HmoA
MILRMWRAQSTPEKADDYIQHAARKVFPSLRAIAGYRGAYLLRRSQSDTVELIVLTLWESIEAVRNFAGSQPNRAVVEPAARVALTSFDDFVTHFDVVCAPETLAGT